MVFRCGDTRLLGIVHHPGRAGDTGVVVVPGGPTYRVGSHRQFVLMARDLAEAGIAVLRFDPAGTGDSEGGFQAYERIDEIDAQMCAAIDALVASVPGLRRVVLWGLCGSCTSNLLYGHQDRRVSALVLVNPWVRTPGGLARAQLWHYYPKRLREGAFWRDMLRGRLALPAAARGLALTVSNAWRPPVAPRAGAATPTSPPAALLPQRMLDGLRRFPGPALFILSESDLAAQEFGRLAADTRAWRQAMRAPRITCHWLPGADHTLSARADHRAASRLIVDWLLTHGTQAGHEQAASHTGARTTTLIHEEPSWTRPGRP